MAIETSLKRLNQLVSDFSKKKNFGNFDLPTLSNRILKFFCKSTYIFIPFLKIIFYSFFLFVCLNYLFFPTESSFSELKYSQWLKYLKLWGPRHNRKPSDGPTLFNSLSGISSTDPPKIYALNKSSKTAFHICCSIKVEK